MSVSEPYTAILVSETHWDRAWYQPFQVFRMRLVCMIDRLLDILEEDPSFHSFMLDGQTLLLEDYLEIRPERRADLVRFVREGRLSIGPWYVLADEYLVSPEALIRNLLLGMRLGDALGGAMREGYVPDSFGHISQLPQILQGFDIDSAIFWRGVGNEGERLSGEFWWEAPDGSRVLAIHLRDGYHNASNLGYPMRWGNPGVTEFDMDLALQRLRDAVDFLKSYCRTNTLLLLNGVDHAVADPNVPRVIACANETFSDMQIRQDTLPAYMARVRRETNGNLPSFKGEFNRGRYTHHLQGVYSSRIYLQQANERAQTLLECYAEPLSAWAWLLGEALPAPFLDLAWRKLLQNHPHDDICGCSIDAVHRENMTRFAEVEQIASTVLRDGFQAMISRINCQEQGAQGRSGVPFVLYNPVSWPRSGTVELQLTFDEEEAPQGEFHLVRAGGQPVPCQKLSEETMREAEVGKHNVVRRVHVSVAVDHLPACGYRVYYTRPGHFPNVSSLENPVKPLRQGQGMENRLLHIEIQPDGTLDVLDKIGGRWFRGLASFRDGEDAGDEYDYSPAPNPQQISTSGQEADIRLRHSGPLQVTYEIQHALHLPLSLSEDRGRRSSERVRCDLVTTVTLRRESSRIDLQTTVDNRARDHRLRVCFPSDVETDLSYAGGHFDVLAREIELPDGKDWSQPPAPTRHQHYFVDLSDGEAGLAVFSRGLSEYEILRDGERNTIAVTLLRCVGFLSRDDLLTRENHAGPEFATPEAQCLGEHTFEYALAPHTGDWRQIRRDVEAFRAPVVVRRADARDAHMPPPEEREEWESVRWHRPDLSGDLPSEVSFLSLEPEMLLLSAVKQSESSERLIVRFYNPTDEAVEARLRLYWPIRAAHLTNLKEVPQHSLAIEEKKGLRLAVAGKQIRTVSLEFDAGHDEKEG